MANPLDLLPLIDGDTYTFIDQGVTNKRLQPGQIEEAKVGVGRGFYFGSVVVINGEGGEDTELKISVDDFLADTSPKEIFNSGFVETSGITPGLSRYDTDANVFTAIHNPQRPLGYNDEVRFSQRAPETGETLRVNTTIFTIGITKPRKFVKQYLELTSPQVLANGNLESIVTQFEERL